MANSIKDAPLYVKAANTDGRVALFERDPLHPDGEVMVYGDGRAHLVGRTAQVVALIRGEQLLELSASEADEANAAYEEEQAARRRMAMGNLQTQAQINKLEAQASGQAVPVTRTGKTSSSSKMATAVAPPPSAPSETVPPPSEESVQD